MRASGVARNDVFVTTKIWPDRHAPDALREAARESLANLGLEVIDLLLLHWPSKEIPIAETIGALNDVKRQGLARHIGLSNFTTKLSRQAHAATEEPLVCNQVEYHPYLSQTKVLAAAREQDMALVAWSPIAKGRVANEPLMIDIAGQHRKSAIQICLRWLVQQPQVAAIPRTSSEQHAASNFDIFDFELSAEEMAAISALGKPDGRVSDNGEIEPDWD